MCCNAQNMKGWKTLIINVLFANTHIHSNTWLKSRNLYKIQWQKYLNSSHCFIFWELYEIIFIARWCLSYLKLTVRCLFHRYCYVISILNYFLYFDKYFQTVKWGQIENGIRIRRRQLCDEWEYMHWYAFMWGLPTPLSKIHSDKFW